jgi:hypothetical protein
LNHEFPNIVRPSCCLGDEKCRSYPRSKHFWGGGVAHGVHQDADPKLVIFPANAWDTFPAIVD